MTKLKICKHGNSLGLNLTKALTDQLRVQEGDYVYVTQTNVGIQISPYNDELLEQMAAAERVIRKNKEALKLLADS